MSKGLRGRRVGLRPLNAPHKRSRVEAYPQNPVPRTQRTTFPTTLNSNPENNLDMQPLQNIKHTTSSLSRKTTEIPLFVGPERWNVRWNRLGLGQHIPLGLVCQHLRVGQGPRAATLIAPEVIIGSATTPPTDGRLYRSAGQPDAGKGVSYKILDRATLPTGPRQDGPLSDIQICRIDRHLGEPYPILGTLPAGTEIPLCSIDAECRAYFCTGTIDAESQLALSGFDPRLEAENSGQPIIAIAEVDGEYWSQRIRNFRNAPARSCPRSTMRSSPSASCGAWNPHGGFRRWPICRDRCQATSRDSWRRPRQLCAKTGKYSSPLKAQVRLLEAKSGRSSTNYGCEI